MQIENSYEGAVRRLARLSNAGVDLLPSRRDDEEAALRDRLRDLEELATLVTEENERLELELTRAKETIGRLQEQLTDADRQRLRELVEAPSPAERRSAVPRLLAALLAVGLAVTAAITLRPWKYAPQVEKLARTFVQKHAVIPWAMPLEPLPAPIDSGKPLGTASGQPTRLAPLGSPIAPPVVTPPPAPVAPPVVAAAVEPQPKKQHHAKKHHRHAAASKHMRPPAPAAKPDPGIGTLLGL